MKLWLLERQEGLDYDEVFGFVIRAETEEKARALAQANIEDEIGYGAEEGLIPAWTDPSRSTCVELTAEGEPGIVLKDFNAG